MNAMMTVLRKRSFFLILACIGLVCGLADRSEAATKISIPGILKDFNIEPLRKISGFVTENGSGLEGVGIYDNAVQVGVTDRQGYYEIRATHIAYTLKPQKTCYQFNPEAILVPGNQYDQTNINFTAQRTTCITISGTVTWKNYSGNTTIPTNPLPMVAMEAYAQDGSLYSRLVTGSDGKYSIDVPVGWSGRVQPFRQGFNFFPDKTPFFYLNQNQIQNFQAPIGTMYRITVSIKKPNGQTLPSTVYAKVYYDGIDHANGSRDVSELYRSSGDTYFDFYSGWIGEIKPNIYAGGAYTLNPPSIRMSAPITSNMTFSFTATPQ